MQLLQLTRTLFALTLSVISLNAAEVTRAQFAKAELDFLGYPTNAALAADLGRSEARRDLSNGVVRLPIYGLPSPAGWAYRSLLESKYNIGIFGLAGCDVSDGLQAYAAGYSKLVRAFVEQKHGTNIWQLAWAEAENPSPAGKALPSSEYRIRAGDTLGHIAQAHKVTLKALQEANPGVNPTRLKVGQGVQIPASTRP